jgi:hypothetical protein
MDWVGFELTASTVTSSATALTPQCQDKYIVTMVVSHAYLPLVALIDIYFF